MQTPPRVTVEQRTSVYADDRTRVADVKPSERWLRTTAEDEREDGEVCMCRGAFVHAWTDGCAERVLHAVA